MSNKLPFLTIILIALVSCGGTHGSIKHWYFMYSKNKVDEAIDSVFVRFPQLQFPEDNTLYDHTSRKYRMCYIVDSVGADVFTFKFYGNEKYWADHPNYSRLSLTHAGTYGHRMNINYELDESRKNRLINKFEQGFVKKLELILAEF